MTIRLPKDAKGLDYEDQVCSLLLAKGYYLETSLTLKKGLEEVLQFDAIATPVTDHLNRKVVEVKSGDWGLVDVFKLYGQTMYTTESSAWLIHKKANSTTKAQTVAQVTAEVPVKAIHIDLNANPDVDAISPGLAVPDNEFKLIFSISWWSRSAERIAQSKFREWYKTHRGTSEKVELANDYLRAIDECLFKKSPVKRVRAFYEAYMAAPQLTPTLVDHAAVISGDSKNAVQRSVWNTGNRIYLQYVMSQEYRARVAIMKNAYDSLLEESKDKREHGGTFSWEEFLKDLLPASFHAGMEALRCYPHSQHIPFFYQVFVEVFGGFYFPEHERDVELISRATGIPTTDIPSALELMDQFFPFPGGWVHKGDKVHFLKGLPAYVRGAGCFAREKEYGKEWGNQFPQLSWQIPGWHNALYKLLEPSLKVED